MLGLGNQSKWKTTSSEDTWILTINLSTTFISENNNYKNAEFRFFISQNLLIVVQLHILFLGCYVYQSESEKNNLYKMSPGPLESRGWEGGYKISS